jgi:membrane-associated PAP2 superfamily phosphatase
MAQSATSIFDPSQPKPSADVHRRVLSVLAKRAIQALRHPLVWIPAIVLAVLTLIFHFSDIDTRLAQLFYSQTNSGNRLERWPLTHASPWIILYDWGCYPAWFLGCGGLAIWIVSFVWKRLEPCRDPGLFFALLLAVGPGLLVNGLAKPYWSRPRPYTTTSFGGSYQFLPVLQRSQENTACYSFPSGHASMGFYLMAPAFVFYRRRRPVAWAFLAIGVLGGLLMGVARMAAGGHYATDVLWAGAIVYFTGLLLASPFPFWRRPAQG